MGVGLEILKLLEEKPRQSPQSMANALPYGISSIKTSLVTLRGLKQVKRLTHGIYEITKLGELVLHQNLGQEEN